jgi:hypothetical protein
MKNNRKLEILERINFWRKQNNEGKVKTSMLFELSEDALEAILKFQYTLFISQENAA